MRHLDRHVSIPESEETAWIVGVVKYANMVGEERYALNVVGVKSARIIGKEASAVSVGDLKLAHTVILEDPALNALQSNVISVAKLMRKETFPDISDPSTIN